MRILAVDASFPGCTGDAHIWRNSNVKAELVRRFAANERHEYLLGKSFYHFIKVMIFLLELYSLIDNLILFRRLWLRQRAVAYAAHFEHCGWEFGGALHANALQDTLLCGEMLRAAEGPLPLSLAAPHPALRP